MERFWIENKASLLDMRLFPALREKVWSFEYNTYLCVALVSVAVTTVAL
ncbi:hypothetical protein PORCRE_462 [Porphyromonas crevioricanis JCM 15906]|uniref:Uncharacterized protein n=1 Tax=Porphyromonas crevioricanis JCM 15906 TaxID=1305617 RepID=T1CGF6_9PORP|nr:hypothetical protein PORCRE_462 [Porphyromonas crevioricanis JCM 15906]GAD08198.1 hypothetical protein PORCAN_1834 [Porphyromonas crevioricanis JCM 13913]